MIREDPLIPPNERRCVVVKHGLENGDDGPERKPDMNEEVRKPSAGANPVLFSDSVFLECRDQECRVESCFGVLETMRHVTEHVDDCLVGKLSCVWIACNLGVSLVDKVFPRGVNVCLVAVVYRLHDLKADVEVFAWIRIIVEELVYLLAIESSEV